MYEHTLVRGYPDQAAFQLTEQPLGQQGGSAAATGRPKQKLAHLQAHLAAPQTAARIVVTYTWGQPS